MDTPAVKLKLWGDALRNTISRMPNEPIEIVAWFASLDNLFNQLCVFLTIYVLFLFAPI